MNVRYACMNIKKESKTYGSLPVFSFKSEIEVGALLKTVTGSGKRQENTE